MKKYGIGETTKKSGNVILCRIIALRDFADVKAGELGGWVESETNLSHDGDARVSDNARVSGNAQVYGNK